jgi:hypothetical protein
MTRFEREPVVRALLDEAGLGYRRVSGSNLAGFPVTFVHTDTPALVAGLLQRLLGWDDTTIADWAGMVVIESGKAASRR